MTSGSRAVLYARVSTKDQEPENQLIQLREYAKARNWQIVGEYVDKGVSGGKEQRPQLNLLMEAVRRRKCDLVLCWRFDRFARSSRHLLNVLDEFRALSVDFCSLQEAIDTSTPAGKMVFSMVAAIAEFEKAIIVERVKAGLSRARAQGKRLGRPQFAPKEDPATLKASGLSVRAIAKRLGVSKSWVAAALSKNPRQKPASGSEGEPA